MIDDPGDAPVGRDGVADRWLRVLLAVVEAGTFTGAGRVLGIGQPAVSHAVKQLETALGAPVFDRDSRRAVVLTEAGRRLAEGVRDGFDTVDRAVHRFRREGRDDDVTLSVSMPLATYWLLPRLGDFREEHPEVELRIATVDTDRSIGLDDADLWVPAGLGDWPGLASVPFLPERIYPVAAPGHPLAGTGTPLARLADADLLVHDHHGRFDWDAWFAHHGLSASATASTPRFGDYALVVRAALAGQGVALGWHHLVRDLVADGQLARVGTGDVVTDQPLPLLARPGSLRRPAVRALRDWLVATAGSEVATRP